MADFQDHLADRADGMDNCLLCQKDTRSHLILLGYDEDAERIINVDDMDDATAFGMVCHSCAADHDLDAEAVVDAYNEWITGLLDDHGVPLKEFVERPGDVADEYDLPEL